MKNLILKFSALSLFVLFFACSNNVSNGAGDIDIAPLEAKISEIKSLLDNAEVGLEDGTYPAENVQKLENFYYQMLEVLSKAKAGEFLLQYEIDSYLTEAEREIKTFTNSVNITILPGEPAELAVYGYENDGYIDFGSHPEYSAGPNWTVEFWLKYSEDFFTGIGDVVSTFKANALAEGWMVNFMGSGLRTTIGMGPQLGRVLEWSLPYPQTYNQWIHIAAVWDSEENGKGALKMYVNGDLFWSAENGIYNETGELQRYSPTNGGPDEHKMWAFKRPGVLTSCTSGFIKRFRLWTSVKSQDDIKQLMVSDVTGQENDLTCAWDFELVPEDESNIPDKTGKYTASIKGAHKWFMPQNP